MSVKQQDREKYFNFSRLLEKKLHFTNI